MRAGRKVLGAAASLVSITALLGVPMAEAGKRPGGGGTTGTSSISLVLLDSTDGTAHYGQQVTFNVSTTQTTEPYVRLNCYERKVWVLSSSAGFFESYPWPWTRNFTLSWDNYHTAGNSADCTAMLYTGNTTLASTSFVVHP